METLRGDHLRRGQGWGLSCPPQARCPSGRRAGWGAPQWMPRVQVEKTPPRHAGRRFLVGPCAPRASTDPFRCRQVRCYML